METGEYITTSTKKIKKLSKAHIVIKPTINVDSIGMNKFDGEEIMKIKPKFENALKNWYNWIDEIDNVDLIKLHIKVRNTAPENVFKSWEKSIKLPNFQKLKKKNVQMQFI